MTPDSPGDPDPVAGAFTGDGDVAVDDRAFLADLLDQPGMPERFRARVATLGDLDTIMTLERAGFAEPDRWSREAWRQELGGHDRIVLLIGADEGVITLQMVAGFADLLRMTVRPEARGRGLGRMLVAQGIVAVAARGARRLLLEVEEDNRPARAVYAATGFTEIDRRDDYYGRGRHALIMEMLLAEEVSR